MYTGTTIFSQLMQHLPWHHFHQCVDRYRGNHKVKEFKCTDHYRVMCFAQLTYRESLRDIEACLRAMRPKRYHMGIHSTVSRNNLSNANEKRDWRILCRVRSILDCRGPQTLRGRRACRRLGCFGLRSGLDDHRPVPFDVSMGTLPKTQGRGQDVHLAESARQHPRVYSDFRRKNARCERSRLPCALTRRVLPHGSRISRFPTALRNQHLQSLLRHQSQRQLQVQAAILSTREQNHRSDLRPDRDTHNLLSGQSISRTFAPDKVPRPGRSDLSAHIPDQRLLAARNDHHQAVQGAVDDRAVLQMDQNSISVSKHSLAPPPTP